MIRSTHRPHRARWRLAAGGAALGVTLAVWLAAAPPVATAATASATSAASSGASRHAAAVPDTLTAVDAAPYQLADGASFATYQPRVEALSGTLGTVTMDSVLAGANRNARSLCHDAVVPGATGFCWDLADDLTPEWFPQGVSGSGDASADGLYQGHHVVAASWYDLALGKGTRLSLVNRDDPEHTRYRHILLVDPVSTTDYTTVPVHAGGIAWYGNYLYVVDTAHGLRVFDLRQLWPVDPSDGSTVGRGADGHYYAAGYSYVAPQVGRYSQAGDGDCDPPPDSGTAPLCFSSLSLDRSTSPPSLLTSEYYRGVGGARLVRWGLDPSTGRLAAGGDGAVHAMAAYQTPHADVQGAVSHDGRFFSATSHDIAAGTRFDERVGEAATSTGYPVGAESLSYWPATGELWASTEFVGKRMVFSVAPGQ
ncbi:MAG: hypothetical protein WCA46_08800 [Actinocatenispora sp.]